MTKLEQLKLTITLAKPRIANNHALRVVEMAVDALEELAGEISALRKRIVIEAARIDALKGKLNGNDPR